MKSRINNRITIIKSIFIVFAGLITGISFANSSKPISSNSNSNLVCASCAGLAPSAPAEATFDDFIIDSSVSFNLSSLSPKTPAEADFSDIQSDNTSNLNIQAAGVPVETDNNYSANDLFWDLSFLAPVTPGEAGFE